MTHFSVCLAIAVSCAAFGCRSEREQAAAAAAASASAGKPPVDRLSPGELSASADVAFGIPVPRGMELTHKFHDVAYIEGRVPQDALVDYVKQRVAAKRVELAENAVIFPRVSVNGQPDNRLYDIEVWSQHGRSRLTIRDVTPVPARQGLSEAQRWERAGLSPTGELLNKDALR